LDAQPLSREALSACPIFTSIKDIEQNPEQVYRLHLKRFRGDSLPEQVLRCSHLQELTVKHARLQVLNHDIDRLSFLQYINLEHNYLVQLPVSVCHLKYLKTLIISRNMLSSLPDDIGEMIALETIEAWDNPLYQLPDAISLLSTSLQLIDLRQIGFRKSEIERIEQQLPHTQILYSNICECKNGRE
jgi:Leucine-rich repeat (LRR) protein